MAVNYQLLSNLGARKTFALLQISCLLFGLLAFAMQSGLFVALAIIVFICLGKFNLKPTIIGKTGIVLAFLGFTSLMPLSYMDFFIAEVPWTAYVFGIPPTWLWREFIECWQSFPRVLELFQQIVWWQKIVTLLGYLLPTSLAVLLVHKTQLKALKYQELIPLEKAAIYLYLILFWLVLLISLVMLMPTMVATMQGFAVIMETPHF